MTNHGGNYMHCITVLCSVLAVGSHHDVLGQSDAHLLLNRPVTVYHAMQKQYRILASCTGVGAAAWGAPYHPHRSGG